VNEVENDCQNNKSIRGEILLSIIIIQKRLVSSVSLFKSECPFWFLEVVETFVRCLK